MNSLAELKYHVGRASFAEAKDAYSFARTSSLMYGKSEIHIKYNDVVLDTYYQGKLKPNPDHDHGRRHLLKRHSRPL